MTTGLLRNRLTDLISDISPVPLWDSVTHGSVPQNEGDAQTGRLRVTGFTAVRIVPIVLVTGTVTTLNIRLRSSNLENPDPATPGDWSSATDSVAFAISGAGTQPTAIIALDGATRWVSYQVWTDGGPGTTQISIQVQRLVAADAPSGAADLVWTEITDSQTGLVDLGDATHGTFVYTSGLWRFTWSGTSGTEDGGQDNWLSKVVPLASLVPDFDWSTDDLWLRLDLVAMSNTGFDGGPCLNMQFNDGMGTRGNPVAGYGYTDHNATNTRWFRQTATGVAIQNSIVTTNVRSTVFHLTNNTENLVASASLIGVGDIPDVDATASGFGFGTNVAEHEVRFGCVQALTGPMPASTVNDFRVYYARALKPAQPAFT